MGELEKRIFVTPSVPESQGSYDNINGVLIVAEGDIFTSRSQKTSYKVVDFIGNGNYGQVYMVENILTNVHYALKVASTRQQYLNQAIKEISVYNHLQSQFLAEDLKNIGYMIDSFTFKGHTMIVLELYYMNLYQMLESREFDGLPLPYVRNILRSIVSALKVLHSANYIHSDIKPENLMITEREQIKLIDFGASQTMDSPPPLYIQSRYYRAPEVILQQRVSYPIDIWSLGCVAAELFTGLPIFAGRSDTHMLQLMEKRIGKFPESMQIMVSPLLDHFTTEGLINTRGEDVSELVPFRFSSLESTIMAMTYVDQDTANQQDIELENHQKIVFMDLLKGVLQLDQTERFTLQQVIDHNFMHMEL